MATAHPLPAVVHPLRRWAFPALALIYALVAGIASFGLPSALTAWFTEGSELPLRTHYVIWGALAGVFMPGAALALMRPERSIAAMQQLLAFVVAAVAGLVLAFETETATYIAMFALPIILLAALHPHRGRLLESGPRMDVPMLALAGVAAIPTGFYALANLRLSAATHFTDDLHGGYAQAGILALALLLSTVVAARGASGWQVPAWISAIGAAMLGLAGVLYPSDPSSLGAPAGAAVLIGSAIMVGLTLTRTRRLSDRTVPRQV